MTPDASALRSSRFEVAGLPFEIQTDCPAIREGLERLYGRPQSGKPPNASHRVRVRRQSGPQGPLEYSSDLSGRPVKSLYRRTRGVLEKLEFEVSSALLDALRGRIAVHGATLRVGSEDVLLIGRSGAGKTTLATALAARGACLYADDFALLGHDGQGLLPVPRFLNLDANSRRILSRAGLKPFTDRRSPGLLTPQRFGGDAGTRLWPNIILALENRSEVPRGLAPIDQAQMLTTLLQHTRGAAGPLAGQVRSLQPLVARARCFTMQRDDLTTMAAALESISG